MGFDQQPYNVTNTTTTTCHHGKGGRWWPQFAGKIIKQPEDYIFTLTAKGWK